ncbi:MAG TPA: hypothetical protein VNC61_15230 [Acidimicrobiales bacterium]|nr:hypothetical protein [Acidimicrobiales bacterium]
MNTPDRAKSDLERRLEAHRQSRWPQLTDARVRFRNPYAYVEATLPDGDDQPLFRLRWTGNRDNKWAFAIWLASKDGYENSVLPNGLRVGTVEEAMDCAAASISTIRVPGNCPVNVSRSATSRQRS